MSRPGRMPFATQADGQAWSSSLDRLAACRDRAEGQAVSERACRWHRPASDAGNALATDGAFAPRVQDQYGIYRAAECDLSCALSWIGASGTWISQTSRHSGAWHVAGGLLLQFLYPPSKSARCAEGMRTPAMAAGLTDHCWSVGELLAYRFAPAPFVVKKRRGRKPKSEARLQEEGNGDFTG